MTGHVIRAVAGAMSVTPIRTWRLRDALLHEVNVEECDWDDLCCGFGTCWCSASSSVPAISFGKMLCLCRSSQRQTGALSGSRYGSSSKMRHGFCHSPIQLLCTAEIPDGNDLFSAAARAAVERDSFLFDKLCEHFRRCVFHMTVSHIPRAAKTCATCEHFLTDVPVVGRNEDGCLELELGYRLFRRCGAGDYFNRCDL